MPQSAYLLAILGSAAGLVVVDRRWRLGVVGARLLVPVAVVEVAFLAFDLLGAARGWFASEPDRVVAIVAPGIPPEEPLLLAFLTVFAIVVFRVLSRWTGEGEDA